MSRTRLPNELIHTEHTLRGESVEALAHMLFPIVRRRTAAALKQEWAEGGPQLVLDEAVLVAKHVLDVGADERSLAAVRDAVAAAFSPRNQLDPQYIDENAMDAAGVMALAWVQFLDLALDRRGDLRLDDHLLPSFADVEPALHARLRSSLATTVVRPSEAEEIMQDLGAKIRETPAQRLPLPRALEVSWAGTHFMVVRTGPHSASSISSATPLPPGTGTKR